MRPLLYAVACAVFAQPPELEIRIIYDNTSARAELKEDWGFAALATFGGRRILFDSGTKPDLFLENLGKLGIAPGSIEQALISHEHGDHRNGIYRLYPLHRALSVHFLDRFLPEAFTEAERIGLRPNRVTGPFQLADGVFSSGLVEGDPPEQALAIETSKGIAMLVGCSHPGVVKMVETVLARRRASSIRLLVGGMHMFRQTAEQIRPQIERLRALRVERIAPAHCTGDLARQMFREAYGAAFEEAGAGRLLTMP